MEGNWLTQLANSYAAQHPEDVAPKPSAPAAVTNATMACPTCIAQNVEVPLATRPGVFGYFCANGHIFNDTRELLAMNPPKLQHAPAPMPMPRAPKPGIVPVPVPMTPATQQRLAARFRQEAGEVMGQVAEVMAEEDAYVVPGDEAKLISQHYGQKIADAQKLLGVVSEMKQARVEAEQRATDAANKGGEGHAASSGVDLVSQLPEAVQEKIKARAAFNGKTVENQMIEILQFAGENGWF